MVSLEVKVKVSEMPHRMSTDKKIYFYTMTTFMIILALSLLMFLIKYDYNSGKESETIYREETTRVDPKLQSVLEDMSRSFRKWDR